MLLLVDADAATGVHYGVVERLPFLQLRVTSRSSCCALGAARCMTYPVAGLGSAYLLLLASAAGEERLDVGAAHRQICLVLG